jgi:hypothetical protein
MARGSVRFVVVQNDVTVDIQNRRRYGKFFPAGTIVPSDDDVTASEAVRVAGGRVIGAEATTTDKSG